MSSQVTPVQRIRALVRPLADLRATVILLILGMFLVLAGTLAQIDLGIWTVVAKYFHAYFVWIPLNLFVPRTTHLGGAIPFPGGWTIGGLLLINVVAAFISRLQWRKARIGLIISHFGIITMLCGEIVTAMYADEGNMSITEGSWSNYTEDIRNVEVFFIDTSAKETNTVTAIADRLIAHPGVIEDPLLPATVEVVRFMRNSRIQHGENPRATTGPIKAIERPEESGVGESGINMPSVYVKLRHPTTGKSYGELLLSTWANGPTEITIGGVRYQVGLRFRRKYRPFELHLTDFSFKRHRGTNIPASFSSKVRLVDKAKQVDHEVLIWMNHPLRYAGETFYQASYRQDERGTVLQVVRNPGWLIPYISCLLVAIGLLIHFLVSLAHFLRRRAA